MTIRRAFLGCLAVLGVITGIVAGCGGGGDTTSNASAGTDGGDELGLIEPGVLTVGADVPYPPFEQGEPPDYAGFDIDLIGEIAERLDLEPTIVDTSFQTIFADQQAGKFDIVASATTITPERSQKVTFSDPYYNADQSLMVQKGSDLTSLDDITSSTRIGVVLGGVGQVFAEEETDAQVQNYAEIAPAFNALQAGQVDAVFNDFSVSVYALRKYPDLEVVQRVPTEEQYGLPMQKTNAALIDAVNTQLKDVIADGTYEDIYKKWFQADPPKEYQPSS